jgi:aquaporin Z
MHMPPSSRLHRTGKTAVRLASTPNGACLNKRHLLSSRAYGAGLQHMRKYIVEFIGTFFLVFTIGLTVVNTPSGVIPPLAIGAILMVMIFAGGHVSGAHYNPAVTLAVAIRGRLPMPQVPFYMVSQVLGAGAASLAVRYLKGFPALPPPGAIQTAPAFLAEFLFTFALCYVVLNVATAKGTANNSFYGLAIGFTVMAGAFAVGAVSGAAFNPAVALGVVFIGLAAPSTLIVFFLSQFLAAVVAALIFKFLQPEDR